MNYRPTDVEHPIKMYIRRDLGITVEQFGKIAGIPQSTLATWIKRERPVEKLPIDFYSALATVAKKNLEEVYRDLLTWQKRYYQYKQESLQAAENKKPLFSLAADEGRAVYHAYKIRGAEADLLEPAKRLRKAIDRLDSDLFIQALIPIYGNIERAMPTYLAKTLASKDQLKEFGQAFYNELLIKG